MAAPANMVSGICGMEHVVQGGNTVLYTATRAGGGVLALDVDAEKVVVDQVVTALGATLPTQATLELLRVNGALQLVVTGANQAKVQTQALQANGALVAPVYLVGSLSGTLSAQSVEVELVLQTRNREHVAEVVQQLTAAGFEAQTA